jgi:hypothetical protein
VTTVPRLAILNTSCTTMRKKGSAVIGWSFQATNPNGDTHKNSMTLAGTLPACTGWTGEK